MNYYKLNERNEIIAWSKYYREGWLSTDKNIVYDIDGRLVFEEETQTEEYQQKLYKYNSDITKNSRMEEIKQRLSKLSQDFVQAILGAELADIEERKAEFRQLHNELRALEGKPAREYKFSLEVKDE